MVFAFHNDTIFVFERAYKSSASSFGGPLEAEIEGIAHGPKPLHMIARLGGMHIGALSSHYLTDIPLIYGMCYDACEITYKVVYGHKIEVLKLSPSESSDDWPYRNFPPLLPYLPLRLSDVPRRENYATFAEAFPNMPGTQQAELVVAVPPPATLGVSLWGGGDGDGVTLLFECDLADRVVCATNVTT